MYSVIELLEQHSLAASSGGGLSLEKLRSFTRPPTQLDQIQQIKTISSLRYSRLVCCKYNIYSGAALRTPMCV